MMTESKSLKVFYNVTNRFFAGEFPIEEFDDRLSVAYGKMTQEEFDIKWGYKPKTIKAMQLYEKQLKLKQL